MRQVMKNLMLALIATWAVVSAVPFSVQAAPFGSSDWWQEMDREGRGGRG
jgi:hypothetical protein